MRTRHSNHFKATAAEIGNMAVKWSYMEFVIDRLIWSLSGLETFEECDIFLAGADVRQKVQIAKSLVVLRPIDEKWKEKVISALDKASNDYRNARNETMHSRWFLSKQGTTRQRVKIRIAKPQSHLPRSITTIEEARPRLSAMRKLNKSIDKLSGELELHFSYSGVWLGNKDGRRAISFAQYRRAIRQESRRLRLKKKP